MWLEVSSTNNDPYVTCICKNFVECVKETRGLPNTVRADRGTENGNIETVQTFLRSANDDPRAQFQSTFLYGKSTSNQRIEAWWSKFKGAGMNTWIEHFKDLENAGIIDTSNELHIQCVRFCYINLLRCELHMIRQLWNAHPIRKSRNAHVPHGKPDIIYYIPEIFGGRDLLCTFSGDELDVLSELLTRSAPDCHDLFHELFEILIEEGGQNMPTCLPEADALLVYLLDTAEFHINHM